MSQFADPINLQISSDSLSQGEQAIRQEIALQLYAKNIFTFVVEGKTCTKRATLYGYSLCAPRLIVKCPLRGRVARFVSINASSSLPLGEFVSMGISTTFGSTKNSTPLQ
jgi:hypothetical protein